MSEQTDERFITALVRKSRAASHRAGQAVTTAAKKTGHGIAVVAKAAAKVVTAPIAWFAKAVAWLLAKAVKAVAWAAFTIAGAISLLLFGLAGILSVLLIAAYKTLHLLLLVLQLPYLAVRPGAREAIKTDWTLYFTSWTPQYFTRALTITEVARRQAQLEREADVITQTMTEEVPADEVAETIPEPTNVVHHPNHPDHPSQQPKGHPTPKQPKRRPRRPRPTPQVA